MLVRQERRALQSRTHPAGPLMYPGEYVLTWARIGLTWHLIAMERA